MTQPVHVAGSRTDTPRCDALSKRHNDQATVAAPLVNEATIQATLHLVTQQIVEAWALATDLERELTKVRTDYYALGSRCTRLDEQLDRLREQDALHTEAEGMQRQEIAYLREQHGNALMEVDRLKVCLSEASPSWPVVTACGSLDDPGVVLTFPDGASAVYVCIATSMAGELWSRINERDMPK